MSTFLQYLAPQRALSRCAGWLSSRRAIWFKNWQINLLINRYGANLNDAVLDKISDYPDFNSFFTRYLKPGLRPIAAADNAVVSPADGCISQLGDIQGDVVFQAKGFNYSLQSLLGGDALLAKEFYAGKFATIYLAPKDYHRVHMPLAGTLRTTVFIPGQLFSVSQLTVNNIPGLFARNERLVCIFDTVLGPMAVILVGAMLVGSINSVWGGTAESHQIVTQTHIGPSLAKGDEMGHFKMGSTVIVLFPAARVQFEANLQANTPLLMGQQLATIKSAK